MERYNRVNGNDRFTRNPSINDRRWIHRCAFCKLCKYDYNRFGGRGDNGARTLAFRRTMAYLRRRTKRVRFGITVFFILSICPKSRFSLFFIFRLTQHRNLHSKRKNLVYCILLLEFLLIIAMPQ